MSHLNPGGAGTATPGETEQDEAASTRLPEGRASPSSATPTGPGLLDHFLFACATKGTLGSPCPGLGQNHTARRLCWL